MIVIRNKKCSVCNIQKDYPNAEIYDMTNRCGIINDYYWGMGTPEIKSVWNTLYFEYGAGSLAMINSKFNILLV